MISDFFNSLQSRKSVRHRTLHRLPPIIASQLKIAVCNQFAPKDKSKRRSTSAGDLGFDDHDLWIAATAIQHNLVVVSADSDFIRIQQAQPFSLESWL
ncbi:PIN domain-containing protein [Oculatella sp. FACHB-28]|uniref:PIN domain-containing protein n=1 Tax=Oculatella sp. FACHB-28 TaxID=2692845 RepID=UPI00321FA47A